MTNNRVRLDISAPKAESGVCLEGYRESGEGQMNEKANALAITGRKVRI